MPDFGLIASRLAAKYDPANLPATPSGCRAILSSTADLPPQVGPTPAILVFAEGGTFDPGPAGSRPGAHDFLVRLYYDEAAAGSLELQTAQVRDWMTLLVDQLVLGSSLTSLVTIAKVVGWKVGGLTYAAMDFVGGEVRVRVITRESKQVTA